MDHYSHATPQPIRLAQEPDFWIGGMQVRPSRGEVAHGDGAERLEPRLMQVLIALAQAGGATVSRDELIARCWGGVVVSPDAVNRVISLLRRLLATAVPTGRLETLARIGYRLIQAPSACTGDDPALIELPANAASGTSLTAVGPFDAEGILHGPIEPDRPATNPDLLVRDLFARAMVGLEQPSRAPIEQALAYLKQVTARAPDFAPGWAALAEAQRLLMLYLPAPMQGAARAESSRSTERALGLDPALGWAYATLANLVPRFNNWSEVETLLEKGLTRTPTNSGLLHAHAQFLLSVGRTTEAVERLLVLREHNPLSAVIAVELATALFDIDREDEAIEGIEQAYALWPGIMLVWSECVRLNVVAGRYNRVQALLDAPPASVMPDDPNLARRRLHLIARRDRRPVDMAAGRRNFLDFSRIGIAPATVAIYALSTLDQPEAAIDVADEIFCTDPPQAQGPGVNMMGTFTLAGQPDSTVLFRRDTANLRQFARFEHILDRIGLEAYWLASKSLPDFRVRPHQSSIEPGPS